MEGDEIKSETGRKERKHSKGGGKRLQWRMESYEDEKKEKTEAQDACGGREGRRALKGTRTGKFMMPILTGDKI